MSREELLESAALDAFGLLDEYEASLYTRSFHHAPTAVQNELIELQGQLVSDETLLPSDLPNPQLRQRVLDAVTDAIDLEAPGLEPLATIGRGRISAVEPVGREALSASGQFWRAAVFALAVALITVLYFANHMSRQNNIIATLALSANTDEQLERLIGPTAKDYIFDRTTERVVFDRMSPGLAARAALYVRESTGEGLLIIDGLPASANAVYTLTIKDRKTGELEQVRDFASTGRLGGINLALNNIAIGLQNAVWQITDETGTVLLASL